jgi:hypothetical protein
MHKYLQNGLKATIPVALIGAIAFSIPMFANQKGESASFAGTPEIKKNISFSPVEAPQGFTPVAGRSIENISALQAAQFPGSWMNSQKNCKFTPSILSMPENMSKRGDEFLSRQYIFDEAESLKKIPSEMKTISFNSSEGNLAAVYASYEISNDGELSDNINSGDYYRTVAARVISVPTSLSSTSVAPDAKTIKSLPVVIFSYDCVNKDAYKENEFKQMVKSLKVDFDTEYSDALPEKKETPKTKDPIVDDPSDDIEDGYTVIKKEFDNPNDVIDRGTGRGAADNSPVVTEPEQPVQITEPAWKQ